MPPEAARRQFAGILRLGARQPLAKVCAVGVSARRCQSPPVRDRDRSPAFRDPAPALTHRRCDLLYLAQQDLDFGAETGQDMTEFTLAIGCGVSLLEMLADFPRPRLDLAAVRMFLRHLLTLADWRGAHQDAVWAGRAPKPEARLGGNCEIGRAIRPPIRDRQARESASPCFRRSGEPLGIADEAATDTPYELGRSSSAASPPSPMFAVGSEAGVAGRSLRTGVLAGGIAAGAGADTGRARRGAAARRAGARFATLRFAAARFGAARFGAVLRAAVLRDLAALDRFAAPRREAAARLDDILLFGLAFGFAFAFVVGLRAFGFLAAILSTPLNFSGNSRITVGMLACHHQQALSHER